MDEKNNNPKEDDQITENITVEESELRKLAARIYDLDKEVYENTGSAIGHVYGPDRHFAIRALVKMFKSPSGSYNLMNDLALIGNMARTLEGKDCYEDVMEKYRQIYRETCDLAEKLSRVEIISEKTLNAMPLDERYAKMERKIICIGRAYGAGGSEIGFNIANILGIDYYDYAILEAVMERLDMPGANNAYMYEEDINGEPTYAKNPYGVQRKRRSLKKHFEDFIRYHGLPKRDAMFFNQSRLILDMAKEKDFVIMGRSAARILGNAGVPRISIFVSAPFENRVARIKNVYPSMSDKEVRKLVSSQDKKRAREYKFFNRIDWGTPQGYDITINSASYGIMGSVNMILDVLKARPSEED